LSVSQLAKRLENQLDLDILHCTIRDSLDSHSDSIHARQPGCLGPIERVVVK